MEVCTLRFLTNKAGWISYLQFPKKAKRAQLAKAGGKTENTFAAIVDKPHGFVFAHCCRITFQFFMYAVRHHGIILINHVACVLTFTVTNFASWDIARHCKGNTAEIKLRMFWGISHANNGSVWNVSETKVNQDKTEEFEEKSVTFGLFSFLCKLCCW